MNQQTLLSTWTLMRRELWESPVAFKWTPLAIGALVIFFAIFTLVVGSRVDAEMAFTSDAIRMFAEQPFEQKRLFVSGVLFSTSTIFFQLMLLIILFYLAGSLFDDRKDRSILFWKSLPVSDSLTVISKVLTACLLVPAMFMAAIILTHLALLLIATVYSAMAGTNPITAFWLPASLPRLWSVMILGLMVQALWLLPIYAWLLFCSSWAPRLPILIAIAIPAAIAIGQHAWSFSTGFRLPEVNLGMIMLKRLGEGVMPSNTNIQLGGEHLSDIRFSEDLYMNFGTVFAHLAKPDMWLGVLIAAVLLAGAIWFRRRATDN
jgi:ABC-2 type transport system permease protein